MVPPGHPCRFPFLFPFFSFFLFFFFFLFSSPFWRVLRVPLPCSFFVRFVLSSRRFPFVSCIALFAFLFASLLSLLADSCSVILVISSWRYTPPALIAILTYAYSPCVLSSFLRCCTSLVRFRFRHRLFHLVFFLRVLCCLLGFGFCCDSFSIDIPGIYIILIRTYADLTFFFCLEVYDLFQLLCVLSSVFICFPPEVVFST